MGHPELGRTRPVRLDDHFDEGGQGLRLVLRVRQDPAGLAQFLFEVTQPAPQDVQFLARHLGLGVDAFQPVRPALGVGTARSGPLGDVPVQVGLGLGDDREPALQPLPVQTGVTDRRFEGVHLPPEHGDPLSRLAGSEPAGSALARSRWGVGADDAGVYDPRPAFGTGTGVVEDDVGAQGPVHGQGRDRPDAQPLRPRDQVDVGPAFQLGAVLHAGHRGDPRRRLRLRLGC